MELIDKIYMQEINLEEGIPNLVISDLNKNMFSDILNKTYLFESDFRYLIVKDKIINIFKMLGLSIGDNILLDNMKSFKSRFNKDKIGSISFNYFINFDMDSLEYKITYYHNGELFNGNDKDSFKAGIKVEDNKTSIYYSLGYTSIDMFKYEIKLNNNITLCREFSKDNVFFIFESKDSRFVIKIDRKVPKNSDSYYILNNEDKLLKYLISIYNYDIDEIINKLCEISLGNDISKYSQITLCESKRIDNRWKDINLLVFRKGRMYELIKSNFERMIHIDEFGNFEYVKLDDDIKFTIKYDDLIKYNIDGASDIYTDSYIGNLLINNIEYACEEVSNIKSRVLEKYSVNRDR